MAPKRIPNELKDLQNEPIVSCSTVGLLAARVTGRREKYDLEERANSSSCSCCCHGYQIGVDDMKELGHAVVNFNRQQLAQDVQMNHFP